MASGGDGRVSHRRLQGDEEHKVSALLLPGIGTVDHLKMAVDCGISTIRIATHCTEADVSEQHLTMASQIKGLDRVGFLMMAHMIEAEELVTQLKLMEVRRQLRVHHRFGRATCCPTMSAVASPWPGRNSGPRPNWAFTAITIWRWVSPTRWRRWRRAPTASMARWPAWVRAPAIRRWKCLSPCASAWAWRQGVDLFKAMDIAEDKIVPMMDHLVRVDRDALTLGYAGVARHSCCSPAQRPKYNLSSRDILVELGRRPHGGWPGRHD